MDGCLSFLQGKNLNPLLYFHSLKQLRSLQTIDRHRYLRSLPWVLVSSEIVVLFV